MLTNEGEVQLPMKATPRLSGEERRAAIIRAVRRVFADKGFDGTTTRELAEAAGVSEALLFKHFPNKVALYTAMQQDCCSEQDRGTYDRLQALEPSASTLVLMVHFLVSHFVGGRASRDDEQVIHQRLLLRSLAGDGEFARLLLAQLGPSWVQKVEECLRAAVTAGDAVAGPVRPGLAAWFTHHLAAILMTHLLPARPVVDYGVSRTQLVEQAVWFSLRGLGLTDAAIRRYYNPKALELFER
jgi:AcrR family transcriptional regulator